MKQLSKMDIKKLRHLAALGLESNAYMLDSELQGLSAALGRPAHDLPSWHLLMSISGQMEELAKQIKFMQSLDKRA